MTSLFDILIYKVLPHEFEFRKDHHQVFNFCNFICANLKTFFDYQNKFELFTLI